MRHRRRLTVNVGIERQLPLIFTQLEDILRHHLIRVVVEEDIDRSHLANCLVHDLPAVLSTLKIDRVEVTLLPMLLHLTLCLLCVLLLGVQIRDEAIGAFHGEENCRGSANARVSAGNQCFLTFKLPSSLVCLVAAILCGNLLAHGLRI